MIVLTTTLPPRRSRRSHWPAGASALGAVALAAFSIPRARRSKAALAASRRRATGARDRRAVRPRPAQTRSRSSSSRSLRQKAAAINAALPLGRLAQSGSCHALSFERGPRSTSCARRTALRRPFITRHGRKGKRGKARSPRSCSTGIRHPAYPASVCGVVYQGSERSSGCQFTFTCDGSLALRAARTGLEPRPPHCRRGAGRQGLCAGRPCHPLSYQPKCCLTGRRGSPSRRSSAPTSSTAGTAAGGSRRRSASIMPGSSRCRSRARSRPQWPTRP